MCIRDRALGHWFFLCVNGDPTNGIQPMNIDDVMALIIEALPNLGDNPDYPDLMAAVMSLAETTFGTCSDEFGTIMRSWEQICVATNHRLANNPNLPCAQLTGSISVCEEDNYFNVCLLANSGVNTQFGRWTILGRNSVYFKSIKGMSGNSQDGSACLEVIEIPDMPFYPQTLTIQYWNSEIGETITRRVTIRDCDKSGPTCEEYYLSLIHI